MNRKITVLVESTQSKVVFESEAATLGELKSELRERQVDYNSDSVFKEAMTKSILASDDSPLPSNIPWKGQITNDLVFMVTAPQKKIKSGAMDRKEAYDKVRELGLKDKIQMIEGKNFTQCATAILISYIEEAQKKAAKKVGKSAPAPVAKEKKSNKVDVPVTTAKVDALRYLLDEMVFKGVLLQHDADNIYGVANGKPALPVEREKSYEELSKEFDF